MVLLFRFLAFFYENMYGVLERNNTIGQLSNEAINAY